jgi:hypothetical protein
VKGRVAKLRGGKMAHGVRRVWPLVLMGWERWQSLPPERREEYKRQAREYAQRGRDAAAKRKRKR